jgi:hypothetical protein
MVVSLLGKIAEEAKIVGPKAALMNKLGDLSGLDLFHNEVMVATYSPPNKVFKGPNGEDIEFHQTDKSRDEDRFQGKVGLVVKLGPLAFKDDGPYKFGGVNVAVGDWVFYRASDGWEYFKTDKTGGVPCRVFEDTQIKGRVSDPAMLW